MSGRRRRDGGWDGGGSGDAQDDRRDPWADSSVDDWGDRDGGQPDDPNRPAEPVAEAGTGRGRPAPGADSSRPERGGATAGAYLSDDSPGAKAYTAPSFPSFQLGRGQERGPDGGQPGGRNSSAGYSGTRPARGPGYGATSAYGAPGERPGTGGARDEAGYGSGPRDAGYGASRGANGGGYPDPGYPPASGYGSSRPGPDRREPSVFEPARGSTSGHGQPGYGSSGYGNAPGFDAPGYVNGRAGGAPQLPEFTPAGNDDPEDDGQGGTPRPIGRLSIYTLHDDKAKEFDVLAERAAEGVRTAEPDTLVYVIHVVPKAPLQRIMYEIYRDRAAFLNHERQPHIRQFAADRAACVLATNVIDLRLKYAKVAALGGAPGASAGAGAYHRSADPAAAGARSGGPGSSRSPEHAPAQPQGPQFSPATQAGAQYVGSEPPTVGRPAAPAPGRQPPGGSVPDAPAEQPAASFTPSRDRYPAGNRQHAATGREDYPSIAAYDNSANDSYGGANGQYGAATAYSPAARYANGGSYPSANGYPGSNGYSSDNGGQGANGYSGANSYRGTNGSPGGNGYRGTNDYPDTNGQPGGGGYRSAGGHANGGGYSRAAGGGYPDDAGQGYAAVGGYPDTGARAYGAQYTPRYREITSGPSPALGPAGQPDNGGHYGTEGRASSRAPERDPRSPDQRLAHARHADHAAVPPRVPSVR